MLSLDIAALAMVFGRYSVSGGRFIDAHGARALQHVLADLVEQAKALERQLMPAAARFTPPPAEAGSNIIPLPRRSAAPAPAWLTDGDPAA